MHRPWGFVAPVLEGLFSLRQRLRSGTALESLHRVWITLKIAVRLFTGRLLFPPHFAQYLVSLDLSCFLFLLLAYLDQFSILDFHRGWTVIGNIFPYRSC